MKKMIALLGVCLVLTIGCKDKNGASASGKSAEENTISVNDANSIIRYTNAIITCIGLMDKSIQEDEIKLRRLMAYEKTKKSLHINDSFMVIFSLTKPNNYREAERLLENPPASLSKEDQAFFKEKVSFYKEQFESLNKTTDLYHDYLRNEDYKDDNWAKVKEYFPTLELNLKNCKETSAVLLDRAEELGEEAEIMTLGNSPLKEPIIAMRGDLKLVKSLVVEYGKGADQKVELATLEAIYKELEANVAKHKGMYGKELKEVNRTERFAKYYDYLDKRLGTCRKIVRDRKDGGKYYEDNYNLLMKVYDGTIMEYNNFVE